MGNNEGTEMSWIKTLSDAEIGKIHTRSLDILENTGIEVDHAEGLRALEEAGAKVDYQAKRARIPAGTKIGRNCLVHSFSDKPDFNKLEVQSGETIKPKQRRLSS